MKKLEDFAVNNKRVLVRCDFNVPLDEKGNILDDFRIVQSMATIQYLLSKKAKVILISHLGEPEGNVIENLKLTKVGRRLQELLGLPVVKSHDCIGSEVAHEVSLLRGGELLLLENVRFHKEETLNDIHFATQLASLGEIYINDAFADCHRSHASIVGIAPFLPHGMGKLLEKEIHYLSKVVKNPTRPLAVLVGGIKVDTKAKFINHILALADTVMVSGLIQKEIVQENLQFEHPEKILPPVGELGSLDINEETITLYKEKIMSAKTIVWNGPFGKFEEAPHAKGTLALAKAIIESKALSIVGGGETVAFLKKEGLMNQFSHISTGGGAMLDYLSGDELPGLQALGT
jgi:3-phosphoglycerate kinase